MVLPFHKRVPVDHLIFTTHEKYINVMCPACYIKWILIFNFWGEWRGHSKQSLCDVDSGYINLDRILLDVEGMEEKE